jgi:uncharacterized Ntn-hydrolase superfamily protein
MTFSIVGRCARTGMLGSIVTTSSMAVGSRCCFAAAGVGAALTQHTTDPRLGPLMLEQLRCGYTAEQAIAAAVGTTPRSDWRQLAIIDNEGRTASHAGAAVKVERAEVHGRNCVAIANIVRSEAVPAEMVKAFEAEPSAPLALRLIDALAAGEAAGGEFKPVTSAGLVVAWRETFPYVDLRVDSDGDPIKTLRRLWREYEPLADLFVARAVHPDSVIGQ